MLRISHEAMTTRFPIKFGKYLLLEKISSGGMAEVYRAKSFGVAGFEKSLAVKRILPHISEDPEFVAMFIDEAKIAAGLHHANICQIVEFGRVGDSYFQAMEYVAGCDMRYIRNRFRDNRRPLPPAVVLHVIERVCDALDYAHRKKDVLGQPLGIVHRDVSPQNMLVSFDGAVKLIDFGIAKAAHRVAKTQAGQIKGKFAYLSPEQIMGQPLDGRSDIFSLGTVMWELLTGRDLFTGANEMDILRKIIRADIPSLSQVAPKLPRELEGLVMQALALSPEDRYPTAGDFMDEIQRVTFRLGITLTGADMQAFMHKEFTEELETERAKVRRFWDLSKEVRVPESDDEAIQDQGRPQTVVTFSGRRLMPKTVRPDFDDDFESDEMTVVMGLEGEQQDSPIPEDKQDLSSDVMELDEDDLEEIEEDDAVDESDASWNGPSDSGDWQDAPVETSEVSDLSEPPVEDDGDWVYSPAGARQAWDEDGPTNLDWEDALGYADKNVGASWEDASDAKPEQEAFLPEDGPTGEGWAEVEDGPTGESWAEVEDGPTGEGDKAPAVLDGHEDSESWNNEMDEEEAWSEQPSGPRMVRDTLRPPFEAEERLTDPIHPSDSDWSGEDGTVGSWPDPSDWADDPTSFESALANQEKNQAVFQEVESLLEEVEGDGVEEDVEELDDDGLIEEIDESDLIEELPDIDEEESLDSPKQDRGDDDS